MLVGEWMIDWLICGCVLQFCNPVTNMHNNWHIGNIDENQILEKVYCAIVLTTYSNHELKMIK